MELTTEEIVRLLDWYDALQRREIDVVLDHAVAEKLRDELHARYERRHTR